MLRSLTVAGGGIAGVAAGRSIRELPVWATTALDLHHVIPARNLLPARTRLFVDTRRRLCWP